MLDSATAGNVHNMVIKSIYFKIRRATLFVSLEGLPNCMLRDRNYGPKWCSKSGEQQQHYHILLIRSYRIGVSYLSCLHDACLHSRGTMSILPVQSLILTDTLRALKLTVSYEYTQQ